MRAMEDLVCAGKVRYLGNSNHAAWQIMKGNAISDKMGWSKFVAIQHFYSLACRDIEREITPLAKSENLALIPWSPLAGGYLSGKYLSERQNTSRGRRDDFDFPPINKDRIQDIIKEASEIAETYDVSVSRVALAWLLHKKSVTSVLIGAKSINQLADNIAASELELSNDDIKKLDQISALSPEYPGWMIAVQAQGRWPE